MTLDKYHLTHDAKADKWRLEKEGASRATKLFDTKKEATKGGALGGALPTSGGSVRIHNQDGKIQEERTFPRDKDPKGSPG